MQDSEERYPDRVPQAWSRTELGRDLGGRPKGSTSYTPKQIDQALLALAFTGSTQEAKEQCELLGFSPSLESLRRWRREYAGRYAELFQKYGAEIDAQRVAEYSQIITKGTRVVSKGIDATEKMMDAGESKSPAADAKAIATIVGIYTDKVFAIQGRPVKIVQHSTAERLRELRDRHGMVVDSTTEEE